MTQTKVELGLDVKGVSTITTADNLDTLTLKSTDADASVGPVLLFNRDSASPAANDFLGTIDFQGDNSAGDTHDYIRILSRILSTTDGSEQADLIFKDATGNNIVNFAHSEVAFNDDSIDRNLRIEGNGNVNLLFVDAGVDSVYINASAQQSDEKFLVNNNDNSKGLFSRCTSGSQANDTVHFDANRSGTSSYNFVRIQSGNSTDSEFILTGDGNAYADVLGMVVVQITQSILNGKMATLLMRIELVAQCFLMVTKLLKLQIVMMLVKL